MKKSPPGVFWEKGRVGVRIVNSRNLVKRVKRLKKEKVLGKTQAKRGASLQFPVDSLHSTTTQPGNLLSSINQSLLLILY